MPPDSVPAPPQPTLPRPTPVFLSFPLWETSGVATWARTLIDGFPDERLAQRLLVTADPGHGTSVPASLPFEALPYTPDRQRQWSRLAAFLRDRAPCIYVPNFDFHRSCAIGLLPPSVAVCSILHSDEDCYYDELERLRHRIDAVVAVSPQIAAKAREHFPKLGHRLRTIPYGVPVPGDIAERPRDRPLELLYCNRLSQYQKQVFELPKLALKLRELRVPFVLRIAGDGPDRDALAQGFRHAGFNSAEVAFLGPLDPGGVAAACQRADLFVLTSAFEGLPLSLLEAMAAGCIPVVYRVESGIPEVIRDPDNGCITPMNDPAAMAARIRELAGDPFLRRRISQRAHATIREHYSASVMQQAYAELFGQLREQGRAGTCRPGDGRIRLPRDLTLAHRLMRRLRSLASNP